MDSREQFEQWAEANGHRIACWGGIDNYMMSPTKELWEAWQASREALVVKLPDLRMSDVHNEYRRGVFEGVEVIKGRLTAAGVRYE